MIRLYQSMVYLLGSNTFWGGGLGLDVYIQIKCIIK